MHLIELYRRRGAASYGGEPVSQLSHALQCAELALAEGAPTELVVAALLHDVGHLLHIDEEATRRGVDLQHEMLGARYLQRFFPAAVTEPVRLHVIAKRYLARDPAYHAQLSDESQRSLLLQGGALSDGDAASFERMPFSADAVRLRRWDDAAKQANWQGRDLESFRGAIAALRRAAS